jgi:uncharacterized tellurite resistance protein B-like protein
MKSPQAFVALSAIAWADGWMTVEESRAIVDAATGCGLCGADLDAVLRATRERQDLSQLDLAAIPRRERLVLLAMAVWIARVDGRETRDEIALIDVLADALQVDPRGRAAAVTAACFVAALPPDARPGRFDVLGLSRRLAEVTRFVP